VPNRLQSVTGFRPPAYIAREAGIDRVNAAALWRPIVAAQTRRYCHRGSGRVEPLAHAAARSSSTSRSRAARESMPRARIPDGPRRSGRAWRGDRRERSARGGSSRVRAQRSAHRQAQGPLLPERHRERDRRFSSTTGDGASWASASRLLGRLERGDTYLHVERGAARSTSSVWLFWKYF